MSHPVHPIHPASTRGENDHGMSSVSPVWVVKLGGSLAGSAALPHWLRTCAALGGRMVLVPGGGPYADAVRRAQRVQGFDDATAHALALGAMERFGQQLCAMQAGLLAAATVATLREALAAGLTPVWMARAMVLAEPHIKQDWSVTSDSLAAWLALRLQAHGLVLVKSVAVATTDLQALAAAGVVDAAFPQCASGLRHLRLLHCAQWNSLAAAVMPSHQPEPHHV